MQLSAAIVVFAASLPHAIVRDPVGSFHTEHQVLDEGNLHTANTHIKQRKAWDFGNGYSIDAYRISYKYRHTHMHLKDL